MNDTQRRTIGALYFCEDCGQERLIDSPADRPTESKRAKNCRNCNEYCWFVIEDEYDE